MKCTKEAFGRADAARKLLAAGEFLSERENKKVEQRIKKWIRDSGQKPAELKGEN